MPTRPAETGGVAAAAALLVAHFLGLTDPGLTLSLAVVIGCIPAAITFVVELARRRAATATSSSSGSAASSSSSGVGGGGP